MASYSVLLFIIGSLFHASSWSEVVCFPGAFDFVCFINPLKKIKKKKCVKNDEQDLPPHPPPKKSFFPLTWCVIDWVLDMLTGF